MYRCLIVEDISLVALGLQSQIEEMGHQVIGQTGNAVTAETIFREKQPDLVLTDIQLGDSEDGLALATRLLKIRACPIIIISAFSEPALVERAKAAGVFGYLVKPVSADSIRTQIEVAVARFQEHMILLAEKESLSVNLENRKVVDRAKGILMTRLELSEPEVHKRLQTESQKRRISIPELARKIIESDDLLGGRNGFGF